jgi:phenylacetic acid degradation operon negative regulatory protein
VSTPASDPLSAQPRALIVTIYGLYARHPSGWLSISALIRLMAELGADEPAVRSAISRLKQRGLVEQRRAPGTAGGSGGSSPRVGTAGGSGGSSPRAGTAGGSGGSSPRAGTVGYALTDRGRAIMAEGDLRIFRPPRARSADGWLLAVFSVPEDQRSRRHALRSRLAWLGFGSVAAGVWIAPAQLRAETAGVLAADGLAGYVSLFQADYLSFGDVRDQVRRWWDLDKLERLYQSFIDAAAPVLAQWEDYGAPAGGNGQAFADYVRVLTAWRRLPFLDPGLPPELLPADWHGVRAAELFARLRALLGERAGEYVAEVTGRNLTAQAAPGGPAGGVR